MPKSPAASRKKVIHNSRKTVQTALLDLNVETHIPSVKNPQSSSASPTSTGAGGFSHPAPIVHTRKPYHHQNVPYAVKATVPKVLPFAYSRIPAMICARPPKANAMGTTALAPSGGVMPALIQLSITVVRPKPARPSGAGFATLGSCCGAMVNSDLMSRD